MPENLIRLPSITFFHFPQNNLISVRVFTEGRCLDRESTALNYQSIVDMTSSVDKHSTLGIGGISIREVAIWKVLAKVIPLIYPFDMPL